MGDCGNMVPICCGCQGIWGLVGSVRAGRVSFPGRCGNRANRGKGNTRDEAESRNVALGRDATGVGTADVSKSWRATTRILLLASASASANAKIRGAAKI